MPTSAQLKQKAMGFIQGIERMSDTAKKVQPNASYGEDFNRLRSMIEQVHPELKELLPPALHIFSPHPYPDRTRETYDEIATFCQQMANLLP